MMANNVWCVEEESNIMHPVCPCRLIKLPAGVMVYGSLCFIKGNMNSCWSFDSNINAFFEDENYIYQQYSAPCHTAKNTMAWFEEQYINVVKWPGNSPDLNPIEGLWGIMIKFDLKMKPTTVTELVTAVQDAWCNTTSEIFNKLIESMPHRVSAVITAKDGWTKY